MPLLRANGPYIWVTWLTKLLVGENSCEWAAWFKTQHEGGTWERIASTFDLASWQMNHTALLNEERLRWEERQYTVFTEKQNGFSLKGKTATLGGRPDLIARNGDAGTIIDVQNRQSQPFAQHSSHTVHVRCTEGSGAIPRGRFRWSSRLFGSRREYSGLGSRRTVRREPFPAYIALEFTRGC